MPTSEQKTFITGYKLRIQNKLKNVVEETENVVATLQTCKFAFTCRVTELLQNTDNNFSSLYEKLYADFDYFQDKLCYLQASINHLAKFSQSNDCIKSEEAKVESHAPIKASVAEVSEPSPNFSASSQTFCKNVLSSYPSTRSLFCSLENIDCESQQEKNDAEVVHSETFVTGDAELEELCMADGQTMNTKSENSSQHSSYFNNQRYSANERTDFLQPTYDQAQRSLSQSTCYQSIFSSQSALKSSSTSTSSQSAVKLLGDGKAETFVGNSQERIQSQLTQSILQPSIVVPSSILATLTHVINPSDFWMQLDDEKDLYCFPMSQFVDYSPPGVQKGEFCLAPFKLLFYYRAMVLTEVSVDEEVEVFFIDHGCNQNVNIKYLRTLPETLYQLPMQAIHCYLCDISPQNGIWSKSAVQKLKEFQNISIKTLVKSFKREKFAVQLIAPMQILDDEDYSMDIGETLCLDGLAIVNEPLDFNRISCDSGVSVTSNRVASPHNQQLCMSSDILHSFSSGEPISALQDKASSRGAQLVSNKDAKNALEDLISFDSNEEMCVMAATTLSDYNPLHLVIPPPSLTFVEKDMTLVMLSHIDTPSKFYVNPAMESSFVLDELREKMTAHYKPLRHKVLMLKDLKEGMFLAGQSDLDQSWYRVKVLRINSEVFTLLNFFPKSETSCDVYVQFIDYGNKALMKISNLRPLLLQFAEHPMFSIKCSLAGIIPKDSPAEKYFPWNEIAVKKFKQLASFERCLTAQVYGTANHCSSQLLESEILLVLLWDTEGTNDVLINQALIDSGVAEFDPKMAKANTEVEVLNRWNPMHEEFASVENSYGVDSEDIGVAISGYKNNDESYVCKYFSLHGYCKRGNRCDKKHVPLAESGVTRDQEEIYSIDPTPSLPDTFSNVLIQVSAVISPGQFYAVLPYGDKDVNEVDSLVNRGSSCVSVKEEVNLLFQEMNKYYSKLPFTENTTIALSYGSIVAAWHKEHETWHRGRIIDVMDVTKPYKVFFVDFGDEDWVERRWVREILPEYLHTPFQAVECHLSDIEALGYESGETWSPNAICYFQELVSREVLLAHVTYRCGKVLHLKLRKTKENDHGFISDILVRQGFAQHVNATLRTTNNNESNYVPG